MIHVMFAGTPRRERRGGDAGGGRGEPAGSAGTVRRFVRLSSDWSRPWTTRAPPGEVDDQLQLRALGGGGHLVAVEDRGEAAVYLGAGGQSTPL